MSQQLLVRHAQLSMYHGAGERARAEYARDCADEHNLNSISTTETAGCADEFRAVFGPSWQWRPEGEYLQGVRRADADLGGSWLSRESRRFRGDADWRDAWAHNQWILWDTGDPDEVRRKLSTSFKGDVNLDLHRWVWRKYLDGSLRMDGMWSEPSAPRRRGTHAGNRAIDTINASVPILVCGLVRPDPREYDRRIDHWGVWAVYPAAQRELSVVSHLSSAVQQQARWSGFALGVASHQAATGNIGRRLAEQRGADPKKARRRRHRTRDMVETIRPGDDR